MASLAKVAPGVSVPVCGIMEHGVEKKKIYNMYKKKKPNKSQTL